MKTAQELLNRIRWDNKFSQHIYKIGYYDRVEHCIIVIPFSDISFPIDDHFSFQVVDQYGETYSIPYHRVKQIYQDDQLIWHRER